MVPSTGLGTDGVLGSRKGGTGAPFLGCSGESGMFSHLGGTDMAAGREEAEMNSEHLERKS